MRHDAQLSIRLPRDLAEKLEEAASARGVDRSDLVRDAIRLYLEGADEGDRPWDRVSDLAGAIRQPVPGKALFWAFLTGRRHRALRARAP